MKKAAERTDLPERLQYTKYYEHDGMLRAYTNRAMVMALLFAVLAFGSLGFAIYVRLQPPTIVRVSKDGDAHIVGAAAELGISAPGLPTASAQATAEAAPAEIEGKAITVDNEISQFFE